MTTSKIFTITPPKTVSSIALYMVKWIEMAGSCQYITWRKYVAPPTTTIKYYFIEYTTATLMITLSKL